MNKFWQFIERTALQDFGLLACAAVSFIWIYPFLGWMCLGAFIWHNGQVLLSLLKK